LVVPDNEDENGVTPDAIEKVEGETRQINSAKARCVEVKSRGVSRRKPHMGKKQLIKVIREFFP
jgi:hypothetical protein